MALGNETEAGLIVNILLNEIPVKVVRADRFGVKPVARARYLFCRPLAASIRLYPQ